jgi:hypothetical protein
MIFFLSTFWTIVHRAFEADMRLMAVGSRLCVVSFRELAQFGPISLNYLQTTPMCTRPYVNTELAEEMLVKVAKVIFSRNWSPA